MFGAGEIIAYIDMCAEEKTSLQRGMNYQLPSGRTVILMSRRPNAPYVDQVAVGVGIGLSEAKGRAGEREAHSARGLHKASSDYQS